MATNYIHVRDADDIVVGVFSDSEPTPAGVTEYFESHPQWIPPWVSLKWRRDGVDTYVLTGDPTDEASTGTDPDMHKVAVSADDTTPNWLFDKLVQGNGITLTELNDGSDEDVEVKVDSNVFYKPTDTSDDITEGATNLFYADEKVDDRVNTLLIAGEGLSKTYDDGANSLTLDLDLNELVADSVPDTETDYIVFYDASGGIHRKILVTDLLALAVSGTGGYIDAYNTGTQTLTTDYQDVTLNATRSGFSGFTLNANEVTCNVSGHYLVIGRVSFESAQANNVSSNGKMQLDTGGGYADVVGTEGGSAGDDNSSPAHHMPVILQLSTGDKIKLQAKRNSGTVDLKAGSAIIIMPRGGGGGGGASELTDLTDVTITAPSVDEVLLYNGADWVNSAIPAGAFADTLSGGDWSLDSGTIYVGTITHNMNTTDVSVFIYDTVTNRQVGVHDVEVFDANTVKVYVEGNTLSLRVNVVTGRGPSGPQGPTGDSGSIEGASDTIITGVTTGEVLKWTGAVWENNTLAEANISSPGHTHTKSEITDFDHTHIYRYGHTWAISGEIKVPSGNVDFINSFYVSFVAGQSAVLSQARHRINIGTSVTCKIQKNGSDVTEFTGISVTQTSVTTNPADVSLADGDRLALVVTGVSGTPQNLSFTLFIDYTQ
jgi:hypothetical protein